MADVKWIKMSVDMFNNRKIRHIETLPEGTAMLLIWVKLLCLAGQCNDSGLVYLTNEIPYTTEMLAQQFDMPLETVQDALTVFERFEMIDYEQEQLHITSWDKYQNVDGMERIREQNRIRKQKQREREEQSSPMSRDRSRDVTQQNKIKNKNKNNINNAHAKAEIDSFYEQIWDMYPNKKGKGKVSDSQKRKLYDIGIDEMSRAIDRYKNDLLHDEWRKPQYGSTFFNSGFEDYLDANYAPPPNPKIDDSMNDLDDIFT